MTKQYSYNYFKEGYPEWKRKKDSFLVRNIFRPISFFTASFAANLGISANQVSFFSMLVAVLAAGMYLFREPVFHVLGAVLVIIWMLLDCTDGNIARSVKKQSYGDFADGISSYVLINVLFICIGMSVFFRGGIVLAKGNVWIVFAGALAASFDSLARLIYQKFANSEYELVQLGKISNTQKSNADNQKGIRAIHRRFTREVGLNGMFLPAILICSIFGWLDVFILFYDLVFASTFFGTVFTLVRKVLRFNKTE